MRGSTVCDKYIRRIIGMGTAAMGCLTTTGVYGNTGEASLQQK